MQSANYKRALLICLLLLVAGCSARDLVAETVVERPEWGAHFDSANIVGTFVLQRDGSDTLFAYNARRADSAFIPASTFKIPNSIMALETGVMVDIDQIIPWDSVDRGWDKWNQDQNLRSGIKYSAVWFYQEIARRIGAERMQAYIDSLNYGNRDISGGIDKFWLEGGIRITPIEQIKFLTRLYRESLPVSKRSQRLVKEILEFERADGYVLRAKTGWAVRFTPQVGWLVGWVESSDSVYYFAINIDIINEGDEKQRTALTKTILKSLNLLEK